MLCCPASVLGILEELKRSKTDRRSDIFHEGEPNERVHSSPSSLYTRVSSCVLLEWTTLEKNIEESSQGAIPLQRRNMNHPINNHPKRIRCWLLFRLQLGHLGLALLSLRDWTSEFTSWASDIFLSFPWVTLWLLVTCFASFTSFARLDFRAHIRSP